MSDLLKLDSKTPVPEWVERLCADFGVLESGAPRYRIIWNPDRTRMCFGREIRKYPRLGERWILETLLPFEIYGHWDEYAFGPKPPDGEYCHSHTIQEDLTQMIQCSWEQNTRYMSLEDFGQDNLRLLIQCVEHGKSVSAWQVRNQTEEMMAVEEKAFHEKFENVYDNHMADLNAIEQLCDRTGLHTSLDPLPAPIEKERRAKAVREGKNLIH
jgi:hypothetical protein